MGADLCLFCINTPKGKQPNYARARKFIDSFTVESLTEHPGLDELENISTEDTGVWTLIGDYHDGEGKISVKDVQGTARDWLKEIEEAFDSGRDCTVFETATETIWITGGMTWGDEPSPTSGLLDKLDSLGVVAHLFYDDPADTLLARALNVLDEVASIDDRTYPNHPDGEASSADVVEMLAMVEGSARLILADAGRPHEVEDEWQ